MHFFKCWDICEQESFSSKENMHSLWNILLSFLKWKVRRSVPVPIPWDFQEYTFLFPFLQGELCPWLPACRWGRRILSGATCHMSHITCLVMGGDLLRSVLNIKNGVEIKSHCYIDSVGQISCICSAYWQNHQRQLLFEPQTCFTGLSKNLCHTVQNRFCHFTGPFQSMRGFICFKIMRNLPQKILNVSDLKSHSK